MKINIENITLILSNIEDLKKYQISQLNYYGYTISGNNLIKNSENIEIDLLKIIDYFHEKDIIFQLSDQVKVLIDNALQEKKEFEFVFSLAKKIKEDGIFDNNFNEFKKFTESLPRKLKPHQLKSAYHFYTLKNGANFSVPGSGKTSTLLSVYEKLRLEGKCRSSVMFSTLAI